MRQWLHDSWWRNSGYRGPNNSPKRVKRAVENGYWLWAWSLKPFTFGIDRPQNFHWREKWSGQFGRGSTDDGYPGCPSGKGLTDFGQAFGWARLIKHPDQPRERRVMKQMAENISDCIQKFNNGRIILCIGCGAPIQMKTRGSRLYPQSALWKGLETGEVCQRCFCSRHYNEITDVHLTDDDFKNSFTK